MDEPVFRRLREEDAEAVAALFRDTFGADRPLDAEEIIWWFENEAFDTEQMRVLEVDGRIVGYGDLWPLAHDMALDVAAPGHWDTFVDWAESSGRERQLERVRLNFPPGHELEELARRRGYRLWRSGYTMELAFTGPPPAGSLPHGFELRTYRPEDEERVRSTVNEAFASDPTFEPATSSEFREFFLGGRGFDPQLWLLAWELEELAGCALA